VVTTFYRDSIEAEEAMAGIQSAGKICKVEHINYSIVSRRGVIRLKFCVKSISPLCDILLQ